MNLARGEKPRNRETIIVRACSLVIIYTYIYTPVVAAAAATARETNKLITHLAKNHQCKYRHALASVKYFTIYTYIYTWRGREFRNEYTYGYTVRRRRRRREKKVALAPRARL